MTIRRGRSWGEAGPLAVGAPVAATDAELAALVSAAVLAGAPAGEAGLVGGDLCRTVAGPGDRDRLRGPDAQRLPVDVGVVRLDGGEPIVFVAHVVAGRALWGPVVAAMNAQFVGRWDVAPRSHPNDGRLDLLEGRLTEGDRWKAWRRLPRGAHVPHPCIVERLVTEGEVTLGRAVPVRIDGRPAGRATSLHVRCVADALTVVI